MPPASARGSTPRAWAGRAPRARSRPRSAPAAAAISLGPLGRQHEPHVERVVRRVVVRDLREGVDHAPPPRRSAPAGTAIAHEHEGRRPARSASYNGPKRVIAPSCLEPARSRAITLVLVEAEPPRRPRRRAGTSDGKPPCSAFSEAAVERVQSTACLHAAALRADRAPRCLKQRRLNSTARGRPPSPAAALARPSTATTSARSRPWIMQNRL